MKQLIIEIHDDHSVVKTNGSRRHTDFKFVQNYYVYKNGDKEIKDCGISCDRCNENHIQNLASQIVTLAEELIH